MNKLKSLTQDALSQVGQTVKQTAKQVVKAPAEIGKEAFSQVAGSVLSPAETNPAAKKETEEFVKGLYAPSEKTQPEKDPKKTTELDKEFQKALEGKTPEEQQKLIALRNQLHQQYYQQLITREKTQEEVERPQARVERLEEQDLQKKQEDKQKKPVLVDRAERAIEANRGVSG